MRCDKVYCTEAKMLQDLFSFIVYYTEKKVEVETGK